MDRVLGEAGIPKDSVAGRRQFELVMEQRRAGDEPQGYGRIRRGWCWGEEAFRKELLGQMKERMGPNHYGPEREESEVERAEGILARELKRQGLGEKDLRQLPRNDRSKHSANPQIS